MQIDHPVKLKKIKQYLFILEGREKPFVVSINLEAGDNILAHDDNLYHFVLAEKPSLTDPDVMTPHTEIKITKSKVLVVEESVLEVKELDPEQQKEMADLLKKLRGGMRSNPDASALQA